MQARYRFSQMILLEAVHKDGTFLDVGCANGHLMEMLHKWGTGIGFDLQMYGLEISQVLRSANARVTFIDKDQSLFVKEPSGYLTVLGHATLSYLSRLHDLQPNDLQLEG
ncbi:MAG: class I SAM-dependent methyltransferase [Symbiobacteriaceae bacterium]|nr:class I SAM-dependent methyltransferase [Symbiobacteriaceae bacterium]